MATERELNILIKAKDMASKVLDKYGDQFDKIGKSLMAVGAAGTAGLGLAIKTAADFESQMSTVKAISGATDGEFKKLNDTAKHLGATTVFSAKQAGEGMEYLALAGWKTNDIVSAMPGLLDLAAAGSLDLGRAADITSDVMSAFGIAAEDATHAADVFAYAQANANTNVEQMGEAMKYAAPVANALGWSMEETGAAMMSLANSGLKGSIAGQAFATSLARLAKPTKRMSETMGDLGMEFFDAAGNMKSMPDVLAEVEKGTKGMTQEQKSATITTLFGAQAYKHWAILLGDGSEKLGEYTNALENSDGAAADMAATMLDNLNGSIVMFKSALEGVAIEVGSVFIPYIRKAVDFVTSLMSAFVQLSPEMKKKIALFAALGSGLALLTGAILFMIPLLPAIGAAMSALFGPVGLVILLIGALATAIYLNFGAIKDFVTGWVNSIRTAFSYLTGGMDETLAFAEQTGDSLETVLGSRAFAIVQAFLQMKTFIVDAFATMQQIIIPLVTQFGEFLVGFWNTNGAQIIGFVQFIWTTIQQVIQTALAFVLEFVQQHGATLISIVTGAFNSIWSVISTVMTFVQQLLTQVWSGIQTIIETHGQTIMTSVMTAFTGIKNAIDVAAKLITQIIEWAFPYVQQIIQIVLQQVIPWAISMFNQIADFIGDVMPKIVKVIQWAWERVIQPLFTAVMNFIVPFLKGAWTAVSNIVQGVMNFVMGIIKTVLSIITGDWSGAWEGIKQILSGAIQAIKGILQAIGEILSAPFKAGLELIKGLATSFFNVGADLVKGLINGIKSMASAAIDAAKGAVQGALDGAKKLLGIKSPSRVFMEIGAFTSEGFAQGIQDAAGLAVRASERMASATMQPVQSMDMTPSGLTGRPSGSGGSQGSDGSGETTVILQFNEGSVQLPGVKNGQEFVKSLEGFALRQAFKTQ